MKLPEAGAISTVPFAESSYWQVETLCLFNLPRPSLPLSPLLDCPSSIYLFPCPSLLPTPCPSPCPLAGFLLEVANGIRIVSQGWKSPYFTESHERFRVGIRKFFDEEVMPSVAMWDELGKHPTQELYLKMGAAGILASRIGPGPHLRLPGIALPGGIKPEVCLRLGLQSSCKSIRANQL